MSISCHTRHAKVTKVLFLVKYGFRLCMLSCGKLAWAEESGAGLSLFIILPREGSIDNGNFGTDEGINGIFSQ